MKDTWKDIPGYSGKYQADKEGNARRIYSSGKTRLMTPYMKKKSRTQCFVVKLTKDGKPKEEKVIQVIARTFLGECPPGHVPYHKNGIQSDNYVQNIAYIPRKELGRLTGAMANRKPVAKLNSSGEITEVYSSAREAGRKNYCSYQTVVDRCNGKVRKPLGDVDYAWEDSEVSIRWAIRRLELVFSESYPRAREVEFEW